MGSIKQIAKNKNEKAHYAQEMGKRTNLKYPLRMKKA